ncbi:MAG: hypothetical protein ACK5OC_17700, partial [Pirellula sp.]
LAGLGEKPSEWGSDALTAVDRLGAYPWFRRLPSHGRSPFRSCPHLVFLSYELFIWYNAPLSKGLELNTRDFHPIRSRPCWAYLQRSRRSGRFRNQRISRRPADACRYLAKSECAGGCLITDDVYLNRYLARLY